MGLVHASWLWTVCRFLAIIAFAILISLAISAGIIYAAHGSPKAAQRPERAKFACDKATVKQIPDSTRWVVTCVNLPRKP